MDEGGDQGGEAVGPAVPKGVLDGKVLPLHVAQLTHRIEKGLPLDGPGRIGANRQESNRVHFPRRLCLGGRRRRQPKKQASKDDASSHEPSRSARIPDLGGAAAPSTTAWPSDAP